MQHREIITQKLEKLEGRISRMESLMSRGGTLQEFKLELETSKDIIQDVKDFIQREPRTAVEQLKLNKSYESNSRTNPIKLDRIYG